MPLAPHILALVLSSVPVTGEGSCPRAIDIQALADQLLPGEAPAGRVAQIDEARTPPHLTLRDPGGAVLFERDLPPGQSCDQLAEIAAVVLVSWLSEPPPQEVKAERLPTPEPAGPSPRWLGEVAVGATGSATSEGLAPGATLGFSVAREASPLSLELFGRYDGPRTLPLGNGQVQWQSVAAGLGPWCSFTQLPLKVEVGASVVVAEELLRGQGFSADDSTRSADPGVDLAVRLTLLQGDWHLWAALWEESLFREEFPTVSGVVSQASLPQIETFLAVGGSVDFFLKGSGPPDHSRVPP